MATMLVVRMVSTMGILMAVKKVHVMAATKVCLMVTVVIINQTTALLPSNNSIDIT